MPPPESNLILDHLSLDLRTRILACAEFVPLPVRTSLYTPDSPPHFMHFVTSGIASVVTSMKSGDSVEEGLNGRESVAESLHLLGPERGTTECFVQIHSSAYRVDFGRFQDEFFPLEPVRRIILSHVQYQTLLTGQMVACNRLHEIEERLARWLLMVADRIGEPRFRLTQEFLADMIGSRRSTVTLTAGALKRSGFIDYQRGEVHILDRPALEATACECYNITRNLLRNFQNSLPTLNGVSHASV